MTVKKRVSRKKPHTPRSLVKTSLRRLWMRSRERAAALKREHYTCEECHRKQSKAKGREFAVEVHHRHGIDWNQIIDLIILRVLQDESKLEVLCAECHDKQHPELMNERRVVVPSNTRRTTP
jgi:hypothetical protein